MEWLANLKIEYVIAGAIVLAVIRLLLAKYKSPLARSAAETVESVLIAVVLVFLIIRPFVIQAFFIPSESMVPTLKVHDHILVNKFIYRFREPRRGEIIVFKAPDSEAMGGQTDFIKRVVGLPGDVIEVKDGHVWRNGKQAREPYLRVLIGEVVAPSGRDGKVEMRPSCDYNDMIDLGLEKVRIGDKENGQTFTIESAERSVRTVIIKFEGVDDVQAAQALVGAKVYADPAMDYYMAPTKVPKDMLFVMGDNRNHSNDSHLWGPLDRNRVLGKAMVRFWPLNRIGLIR